MRVMGDHEVSGAVLGNREDKVAKLLK